MSLPDGPEEREFERESDYERDIDTLDVEQMLADEERHDAANLIAWPERITVYLVELDDEIWK